MIWPLIFGAIQAAMLDAEQRINQRIGRWISPRRYR
jgi:hypothetical protein